jgi:shikimate dehydrogenase
MKKYLVIGNPIEHSLSPKLHNYWFKAHNIKAIYEKKKVSINEIENLISNIKNKKISGINVTVPYKKDVISYLDHLSPEARETQSVNTISLKDDMIVGHNTDISGFELSIRHAQIDLKNKKVFILGAGGVVSSIIYALKKFQVSKIAISNRTRNKAENLKKVFKDLEIVEWGKIVDFDMIINATSIGLNYNDEIELDLSKIKNKIFYDVIYNPAETRFLKSGKKLGNNILNGKMMFIYQALSAFNLWHEIKPEINHEVIKLLD